MRWVSTNPVLIRTRLIVWLSTKVLFKAIHTGVVCRGERGEGRGEKGRRGEGRGEG